MQVDRDLFRAGGLGGPRAIGAAKTVAADAVFAFIVGELAAACCITPGIVTAKVGDFNKVGSSVKGTARFIRTAHKSVPSKALALSLGVEVEHAPWPL